VSHNVPHAIRRLLLSLHGLWDLAGRMLMWQMVKRRWFAALTEHNTNSLFVEQPPGAFVDFVALVTRFLGGALKHLEQSSREGDELHPFAQAVSQDAIRLMFKGGNVVNLIKCTTRQP
jgi:hypothetical protein